MIFFPSFILRVVPHITGYSAVPTRDGLIRNDSNPLHRTKSGDSKHHRREHSPEPGTHQAAHSDYTSCSSDLSTQSGNCCEEPEVPNPDTDETSSLMSKSSMSGPGDIEDASGKGDTVAHDPHQLDIRGVALLSKVEFWQLWLMLGLLTGIGLMTIK